MNTSYAQVKRERKQWLKEQKILRDKYNAEQIAAQAAAPKTSVAIPTLTVDDIAYKSLDENHGNSIIVNGFAGYQEQKMDWEDDL
jgi:hypothetical protein